MKNNPNKTEIRAAVQQYYGQIAQTSSVKSCCVSAGPACCPTEKDSTLDIGTKAYADAALEHLPPEVTNLSLGCGDPVTLAELQPGQTVLDLGSGGGIDCFLASAKVGPTGKVIGIDMTEEMLDTARSNQAKLGIENVEFRLGEIENLPIIDNTVDVIISNCVINLSSDKLKVFQEAFRVLKPGGKFAVSDIVTDGCLPEDVIKDLTAWASCVGGALNIDDLVQMMKTAGFINIHVEPYYWDAEIFSSYAGVEGSRDQLATDSAERVREYSTAEFQAAIFSAKITANKPQREG